MKVDSRRTQGIAISAALAIAIVLILLAANLDPYDRHCAWVFPKILSCLLSARETLAAGLIAAGGALFAAWLAWSGLQDQIGMALKNKVEAERLEQQRQVQKTGRDVELIRIAHGFVESLASEFPTIGAAGVSDIAFASRLLDLRHRGSLHLSLNAAQAPDGNGDSVATVLGRLNILADDINEETKSLSADMLPAILRNRDAEVRAQVSAIRDLEQILAAKIPRYEAKFRDAASKGIE
jgi:hypothetical protein